MNGFYSYKSIAGSSIDRDGTVFVERERERERERENIRYLHVFSLTKKHEKTKPPASQLTVGLLFFPPFRTVSTRCAPAAGRAVASTGARRRPKPCLI